MMVSTISIRRSIQFYNFYMQAMCLHIKVAELNTPSDGNGITGIPRAGFFLMRWEIKRRKNGK